MRRAGESRHHSPHSLRITPQMVASFLLAMLLTPLISPVAAEWDEDSWLVNIIGPERLAAGDEFGCHGMGEEHYSEYYEEISACREYLTSRIAASRWGQEPLSLGVENVRAAEISGDEVESLGFMVADYQFESGNISSIAYNGGTFEKNVGSLADFDAQLEAGEELINFYWMGREHDVVVRPESALVSAIESTTAWFTTWGEHYSYSENMVSFNVSNPISDIWQIEYEADSAQSEGKAWLTPTTNRFTELPADVVHVKIGDDMLSELDENSRHLQRGWHQLGNDLIITLEQGDVATVQFESSAIATVNQEVCPRFNCLPLAITVAGHHTSDLFDWSRRWDDSPLRFTWLVEPRAVEQFGWFLPALAVVVALAAPVTIIWLVKNDQRAQRAAAVFNSLDRITLEEE